MGADMLVIVLTGLVLLLLLMFAFTVMALTSRSSDCTWDNWKQESTPPVTVIHEKRK